MSDSTALETLDGNHDIQLIWNERINKYEALDLKTGRLVANYIPQNKNLSSTSVSYTHEIGDRIVDALARGKSLTDISKDASMPPISAIRLWRAQNPEFKRRMELAYRDRAEYYHDEAIAIAMQAITAPKEMQPGLKLAVSTLQWAAEKDDSQRYGAKKESSGNGGGITVIIDTGVKTQQPTSVNIEVDANGEFRGYINEETHSALRGSESTRPELDRGTIETTAIELSTDRWRETGISETSEGTEGEGIEAETRF